MSRSTSLLEALLALLTREARGRAVNDSQWAQAAGLRKETLSRLRRRTNCDLVTLEALAVAVGMQIGVVTAEVRATTPDGHLPARMDREYEEQLLNLCASGDLDHAAWRAYGPGFFMAGVAVMLASTRGADRQRLLGLAELLHPGISQPAVFEVWLARSPLRPSRFLPMLSAGLKRAA